MRTILLILSVLLLFGCATQQQKEEKRKKEAHDFYMTNKDLLANLCKKEFPNLITEFIPGKPEVKTEIEYLLGEIIPCPEPTHENPKPSIECPPNKHIKEKVTIRDTIKIADTRDLYLKESENQKLSAKIETQTKLISNQDELIKILEKEKNEENKSKIQYMWMFYSLLTLVFIYIAFKIYRKFFLK